ncbi:putative nucleic acid-binding protein [Algoriphagus ratkowskyi]|uniref:Putative nucleic acid-binding protein n=1 Tax=Algoriphagus ratkowskyi TaxID=57028 RepID=A0A2W7RN44_9BACT|nr:PIN domain-containing protein [Algoriphagus ratkowskyi]PZX55919.1 putative nucleic acid-binding protein [Algoriphagus ratkowskyi]TXD77261.1 type II toxin-antitoxin system VapC family toxin [Algoriphagus ratkowskyi]
MKKLRIYLDTSVFGGLFDEEFQEYIEPLFKRIENDEFVVIFSNITKDELYSAPQNVRQKAEALALKSTEFVKSDLESVTLAKRYIEEGVVDKTSYADCLHIALATIYNANILVSWNFKHIVNVVRIIGYNSVNLVEGYKQLDIRSPRELLSNED